jgi:subtilisin family serine protease
MSGLEKLDSGLQSIYTSYRDVQRHGAKNVGRIHPIVEKESNLYLYLTYEPPLAPIEALGFKLVSHENERRALGLVRLADLEAIAAHPAVKRMETGTKAKPTLDISIPDIKADQVRTVTPPSGTFTGKTGKGVIVGIIDTGLDYHHPDFRIPGSETSRVLRIWDQGLKRRDLERSPVETLLTGAPSYGVEYTNEDLSHEISLGANAPMHGDVRHRDCAAHGTHVASTAAGNGSEGGYKYVGVAPEADIVAVKLLDLEEEPTADDGGAIPDEKQFKDAVMYVLNVAKELGKPVVINISAGYDLGPHDGLTTWERFLAEQFPPDAVGRACVVSAGNSGRNLGHVEIDVPAGGEIAIPLRLLDERGENKGDYDHCEYRDDTEELSAEFWYTHGPAVTAAVKAPGESLSSFIAVGGSHEAFFGGRKKLELTHKQDDVTVAGHAVQRNVVTLTIKPEGKMHGTGMYEVRLKSDQAVKIEAWAQEAGIKQLIRFGEAFADHVPVPPEMHPVELHRIAAFAGSTGVISVACYNAELPPLMPDGFESPFDTPFHQIASFSSRGGLVDYTGSGTPPPKPELAAPGIDIDAARSGGRCWWSFANLGLKPYGYTQMQGTSMSAPHVTGTVALMLQIKPDLTFGKIGQVLRDNVVPRPTDPDAETDRALEAAYGAGRLNVKDVIAAVQAIV